MGHAKGQAIKSNGKLCTVLTRLYSVQDIRHFTWISVELGTIFLFCACRNFVQEIRVKAVVVMDSFFAATSQIIHTLSNYLALNNTVCGIFSLKNQTVPCTMLSLFRSYRQQLPPLLFEPNITCFLCSIQPPSDENGYAEIHLHVLIACVTIVESFAM